MNDKKVISTKTPCVFGRNGINYQGVMAGRTEPYLMQTEPPVSGGHRAPRLAHLAEGAVVPCPEALVAGLGLLPRLPQPPLQGRLLRGHVEDHRPQVGVLVGGTDPVLAGVRGGAEMQALENTGRVRYGRFRRVS